MDSNTVKHALDAEEDAAVRRIESNKLARHLYDRHKTEFWALVNLAMSTTMMVLIGHSTYTPSLFTILFGLLGSELGQVMLVLQTLNLRRIWQYHPLVFNGWFGRLAALANAWSYGMLLRNLWAALGTRQAFSRCLEHQGIQPRAGGSTGRWHYVLSLIPLFIVSRRGKTLRFDRSVRYANMERVDPGLLQMWRRTPTRLRNLHFLMLRGRISQWLSLDVIRCEALPVQEGPVPVLMYIHGGGWLMGDKMFSGHAGAIRVASRGVIVVMVNYRMAPESVWPAQIIDCKRALAYVKKHAREWGGDPNRIFVSGESAGGHLSALMGCTPNLPEFQPPEEPLADTSVAGALPIYGVFDITDQNGHLRAIRGSVLDLKVGVKGYFQRIIAQQPLTEATRGFYNLASPTFHIRQAQQAPLDPNICPYFLCHGTLDMLASFHDTKEFYDELQKVRARFGTWAKGESDVFVEVTSGLHGFGYFPSARANAMADAMVDFIFHHTRRLDRRAAAAPRQ